MIIMKTYKGKNYLTNFRKFPERLEYISGNFPAEISELATLRDSIIVCFLCKTDYVLRDLVRLSCPFALVLTTILN